MEFDNSWDALLRPGKATTYFDGHEQTKFQVAPSSFSIINAWWLAEIARLIYRQEADEVEANSGLPTRNDFLRQVGLRELIFIKSALAQCAVIKSDANANAAFRVLVFRGTDELIDWLTNLEIKPTEWPGGGLVHQGFLDALETVWSQIERQLEADDSPVFYTGHSLGAALATLAAARRPPQALYTYGSPRVGNRAFAATLRGVKVYRVVNNRDAVTTVPPPVLFHHLGELHYVAHDGQLLVNPDETTLGLDRLKRDTTMPAARDWRRHFTDAPELLADHAPVNYVAHLERVVKAEMGI